MKVLQSKNWWLYLILSIITGGIFSLYVAHKLELYDEDAWYSNYKNWVLGVYLCIFPVVIMFIIFVIQINCKVASTLYVPGSNIYNQPYSWILCIVVPVVGWTLLLVMYVYIIIWSSVMIYHDKLITVIEQ